jgi:melibiase-like protein
MNRPTLLVGFFLCALAAASASAQGVASLRTADTVLRFENTPSGPRLMDLTTKDGQLWRNGATETPPNSIEMGGQRVPVRWHFNREASRTDAHEVAYVYDSSSPKLRLTWEWIARADFGPIEHQIIIENLDSHEIWIPFADSIQLDWKLDPSLALKHVYVEKGAGKPSDVGTHNVSLATKLRWLGTSSTYADPDQGEPREIIPWSFVQRTDRQQSASYVGIEFSGRTRIELRRRDASLRASAGLNPNPAPFQSRLKPGESFETPLVFLGGSTGGLDAAGNVLRRWVRQVLTNAEAWKNSNYPLLVNNSWGSGMAIDEALARKMLRDSADLQFEMFHIDAGWFRGVGDWYPDPRKFPNGLTPIADEAHRLGLKFGLWVDWTQAALDTEPGALNVRDPKVDNWVVADTPADWKPEPFKGQTIDLGVPEARDWAQAEVERIVSDYHLDMLEHDGYLVAQGCVRKNHPHAPPDPANLRVRKAGSSFRVESSNSTDVSFHATRAYYSIHANLRKQHPQLLLEICNDGGRMVDFGSATHGDYFSITDAYDPLSNRRAFYDASHVLPAAMLETYVEKWPAPRIENFVYMLRSGMMGWLTIMLNTTAWSSEQRAAAKAAFALYKADLRPLIRDADLYHVSARPDGVHWDGLEYFDPTKGRGVLYAFRGSTTTESTHIFPLQGVHPGRSYRLHFQDHSAPDRNVSGSELLSRGVSVSLPVPLSSELIFLQETK